MLGALTVQQLDGNEEALTGLWIGHEWNWLQALAQRDTPPIKVDDLLHAAMRRRPELEVDSDRKSVV